MSKNAEGRLVSLNAYNAIFPSRNNWKKPFETVSGETVFRKKTNKGLFKLYGAFDATNFELTQEDINYTDGVHFKLNNQNYLTAYVKYPSLQHYKLC